MQHAAEAYPSLSQSSGWMCAWLRMLRRVPTGTSCFLGTIAVSTMSPERRTNLTWLPFCPASANPAASRRRLISRKGWGLSRPNLNLDGANPGRTRCLGWFEVKLQGFLQVRKSFFLAVPLTGNIDFKALRDIPIPLAPDRCREWPLHETILAHVRGTQFAARQPADVVVPHLGHVSNFCGLQRLRIVSS